MQRFPKPELLNSRLRSGSRAEAIDLIGKLS